MDQQIDGSLVQLNDGSLDPWIGRSMDQYSARRVWISRSVDRNSIYSISALSAHKINQDG